MTRTKIPKLKQKKIVKKDKTKDETIKERSLSPDNSREGVRTQTKQQKFCDVSGY